MEEAWVSSYSGFWRYSSATQSPSGAVQRSPFSAVIDAEMSTAAETSLSLSFEPGNA